MDRGNAVREPQLRTTCDGWKHTAAPIVTPAKAGAQSPSPLRIRTKTGFPPSRERRLGSCSSANVDGSPGFRTRCPSSHEGRTSRSSPRRRPGPVPSPKSQSPRTSTAIRSAFGRKLREHSGEPRRSAGALKAASGLPPRAPPRWPKPVRFSPCLRGLRAGPAGSEQPTNSIESRPAPAQRRPGVRRRRDCEGRLAGSREIPIRLVPIPQPLTGGARDPVGSRPAGARRRPAACGSRGLLVGVARRLSPSSQAAVEVAPSSRREAERVALVVGPLRLGGGQPLADREGL